MSSDVTRHLELLEVYRRRFYDDLAPARAEFAAWLRNFFAKRKPTKRAEMLFCMLYGSTTNQPRWHYCWQPGSHNRDWIFESSTPWPSLLTDEEVRALGLTSAYTSTVQSIAYWDLTVDAWADAGGFSYAKPLFFSPWVFRNPDDPRPWVDSIRELIQKSAAGELRVANRVEVYPPVLDAIPKAPTELLEAVRSGKPTALADWADHLVAAGDPTAAALLRWLVGFCAKIAPEVRAVAPTEGFEVHSVNQMTSWVIGDCDCEVTNEDTRNLGRLLAGWNNFHPAVEWLYRNLEIPQVMVESTLVSNGRTAERRMYDLAAGDQFAPFEPTVGVTHLTAHPVRESE